MRVAILANFPLDLIPSLSCGKPPKEHYATWLPPLAEANAQDDGIERVWITLSDEITERKEGIFWNQRFITLPAQKKGRASSFYKEDRATIAATLREIKPDVVHGWGNGGCLRAGGGNFGFPFHHFDAGNPELLCSALKDRRCPHLLPGDAGALRFVPGTLADLRELLGSSNSANAAHLAQKSPA